MTGTEKTLSERILPDPERTARVAQQSRRVVLASQGILAECKISRRRTRAVAIFAASFILFGVTPLVWWTVDTVISGEHPGEISSQIALWFATFCVAILAAVLVAGWLRAQK